VASIPAVKALEARHETRGLRVIGVTKHGEDEEERATVGKVAKEHGMTAPSFLDHDGSWSKSANLYANPGFALLDREGKLAYRFVGKLEVGSKAYEEMSRLLEAM
jgi:hypothetical protein